MKPRTARDRAAPNGCEEYGLPLLLPGQTVVKSGGANLLPGIAAPSPSPGWTRLSLGGKCRRATRYERPHLLPGLIVTSAALHLLAQCRPFLSGQMAQCCAAPSSSPGVLS